MMPLLKEGAKIGASAVKGSQGDVGSSTDAKSDTDQFTKAATTVKKGINKLRKRDNGKP